LPRKKKKKRLVCSSRQFSSIKDGFVKELLSKECHNIVASQYPPDLARPISAVPSNEISIAGRAPCEATDINMNVKEVLKRLSQYVFQESLQQIFRS
jgi:hypothetical protein